jgi:alpha-glucosidase (family GH31 glycosyl hydrolase)
MWTLLLLSCTASDTQDTAIATAEAPWPEWAFHHWVWEDESTQDSALALVDGYLERDIPVGAIIIDSPWATGYNTFEWDTDRFPDPVGMIDELHEKGVRVFLWIVPAINLEEEALYNYAAERDWFMRRDAEHSEPAVIDWWKGDGSLIDYWNPEAVDWWHGLMDQVLDMGIDGWKCDGLDFSAILAPYSPATGEKMARLEYSHAYYRDFHDYTREKLGDDRVNTSRPVDNYGGDIGGDLVAFTPVDIAWAGWVGDQDATFEGLQAALLNFYWSSDYGYVAFGSDIGGYREDADYPAGRGPELFIRWAQLGAFNPIMENGGGGNHEPWIVGDEETLAIYKDFVALHMDLLPYLMKQGAIAFEEGVSLMRFVTKTDYTYLLGPDLFVAPMLSSGTSRTLTLPSGDDWVYLFDASQSYSGGSTQTLEIPLAEFPVFLRAGSELETSGYAR